MGDRSNVVILDEFKEDSGVVLYSHWGGTDLYEAARQALNSSAAIDRWYDGSYLGRILVHQILDAMADPKTSTGFGLSTSIGDFNYDSLVIDPSTQRVTLRANDDQIFKHVIDEGVSFKEFCNGKKLW